MCTCTCNYIKSDSYWLIATQATLVDAYVYLKAGVPAVC